MGVWRYRLSRSQRLALRIAGLVCLAAVLFPPFALRTAGGAVINLGYGFLFAPPSYRASGWDTELVGTVDVPLLAVELIVIGVVACVAYWTMDLRTPKRL
jgi:hypothetical protein